MTSGASKTSLFKWVGLLLYHGFARHLPDSKIPVIGKISMKIREYTCRLFIKTGRNVNICRNASWGKNSLSIGDESGIGPNFRCFRCNMTIGSHVLMAPDVLVYGGSHQFKRKDMLISDQGMYPKTALTIGDDVWIAYGATITAGCTHIGTGAVIGARAVVTKDVPEYAVVAGNPAKVISWRE